MTRFPWPGSMLEEHNVPAQTIQFFQEEHDDYEMALKQYDDLRNDYQLLKDTSAKQERYIAELEKQLILLQKTLDLIDKNGGGRVWQMLSGSK